MEDNNGNIGFDFSLGSIEKMGASVMKRAFRSVRQILICLLYLIALFFVLNDFSFTLTSAEDLAVSKLPWLLLYVLAHYFCRDYGIQKGREDEEYLRVEKEYRELCELARRDRRAVEQSCAELSEHYERVRRQELLVSMGIREDENGEPCLEDLSRRALRRFKRRMKRKPIRITFRMLVDNSRGNAGSFRPLKPSFESYVRRTSAISVLKIVLLSCFTFSLTATLGSDPLGNLIAGIPYLATMISVSMTAALGAYRSVLSYETDCLCDRIAILSRAVGENNAVGRM